MARQGPRSGSSKNVRDVLAAAASPHPGTGAASTANSCSGSSAVAAENADGDYFFCAANGSELSDLFRTAISQVSKGVRLVEAALSDPARADGRQEVWGDVCTLGGRVLNMTLALSSRE